MSFPMPTEVPEFRVRQQDATAPFVMGMDVGSGGSRAGIYDATGREVRSARGKTEHSFTTKADGTSTIDADQVVDELVQAMTAALENFDAPISAIGIDTFASSLVPVDAAGDALGPCLTYADTRSRAYVKVLEQELDTNAMQYVTGTRMHSSYNTSRLMWFREEQPDVFRQATRFMALGEYVAHKLLGQAALGTAAASWGGMLDRRIGEYTPELLTLSGVDADALGRPIDPQDAIPVADTPLAKLLPKLAGAVWVPVVGDGLAANVGIGASGTGTWGISTATSGAIRMLLDTPVMRLPLGLWAYRVDAKRTLFGSAMSDCGRVLSFMGSTFQISELAEINKGSLFSADPDPDTPLVIPFLSGERGTKWRDGVKAIFAGVSAATTPDVFLRGALEGVALSYLRIADQLREAGGDPERIVLSGGMTNAIPGWVQILADALGEPIDHIDIRRSTMRGASLLAREQVSDLPEVEVPIRARFEPVPDRVAYYRERLERFEVLADHA